MPSIASKMAQIGFPISGYYLVCAQYLQAYSKLFSGKEPQNLLFCAKPYHLVTQDGNIWVSLARRHLLEERGCILCVARNYVARGQLGKYL